MYRPDEFIFYVFSYNRYSSLVNLIESIQQFYRDNKVIIFDDNSNAIDLLNYYKDLKQQFNYEIVKTNFLDKNKNHGGLYQMMNLALNHACSTNFKYAFFIQDDLQFLQYTDLSQLCESSFTKWQNALMISPLFFQKIYSPQIDDYIEEKKKDFLFKNYGLADIGIIHIDRAIKVKLRFDNKGEKYNGNFYFKKGYQLIFSANPCLSWVPWAYSFKDKNKKGFSLHRSDTERVKYINQKNKAKLIKNKGIPFLEDYTSLKNPWIPKPYLHINLGFLNILNTYIKYIKYVILKPFRHE